MTLVVTFRVFVKLEQDESGVKIVGNCPPLGRWNPDEAMEMLPEGYVLIIYVGIAFQALKRLCTYVFMFP